eukprot:5117555-Pyramimonas_sp.AAC.1
MVGLPRVDVVPSRDPRLVGHAEPRAHQAEASAFRLVALHVSAYPSEEAPRRLALVRRHQTLRNHGARRVVVADDAAAVAHCNLSRRLAKMFRACRNSPAQRCNWVPQRRRRRRLGGRRQGRLDEDVRHRLLDVGRGVVMLAFAAVAAIGVSITPLAAASVTIGVQRVAAVASGLRGLAAVLVKLGRRLGAVVLALGGAVGIRTRRAR